MKHERVYYTCEGCGCDLPEEGHTEVQAVFTGHPEPTPNDEETWELCAKCWLDVFAILDRQRQLRSVGKPQETLRERLSRDFRYNPEEEDPDVYRPWLDD